MIITRQPLSPELTSCRLKRKIAASAAIFFISKSLADLLRSLYHRANAFGAQHFAHLLAVLKHTHRLQIRFERPRGSLIGPWTIATEGRFLTAMCTLSHNSTSLFDQSFRCEDMYASRLTAAQVYHKSLSQASRDSDGN